MHSSVASYNEDSTLFVYGSLIEEARRIGLLGRSVATTPATLRNHALGRARYFYISAQAGAATKGLLLLDLTAHDFGVLDHYEELPLYTREKIGVAVSAGRSQHCWVYMPTPVAIYGR